MSMVDDSGATIKCEHVLTSGSKHARPTVAGAAIAFAALVPGVLRKTTMDHMLGFKNNESQQIGLIRWLATATHWAESSF